MRGSNFSYLVKQGVVSVWRNRMMSFASFCIIMVSLLLIGLSLLIGADIGIVIGNAEEKNEVLVYTENVTDDQLVHIEEVLKNSKYAERVVFYSKEEAWEAEKAQMEEYAQLFDALKENPMPDTYRVTVNDLSKMAEAKAEFEAIDGVESVSAPFDFASMLVSIRTTMSIIAGAVLAALIVVCLVIVYNASRTSVFARRKDISIMKSVGATNAFIRFPFFIEGVFIGVLAGVASWLLTMVSYNAIVSFFAEDITIWRILGLVNVIRFDDVSWLILGFGCLAGAVLGALGTIFSIGKHLKV